MRMLTAIALVLLASLPAQAQRLPLPNEAATVAAVADANPVALDRSCQSEGGSWALMDAIVDTLRSRDKRWGYNGKRGNANDPSHDAIAYHYGSGPREGSTDVYIIDVIGGHCGSDPRPAWIDQTEATRQAGTIGRWLSRGRFSPEGTATTVPGTPTPTPTPPTVDVSAVLAKLDALAAQVSRLSAQVNTTHAAISADVADMRGVVDAAAHDANVGALAILDVKNWLANGLAVSLRASFIGTINGEVKARQ